MMVRFRQSGRESVRWREGERVGEWSRGVQRDGKMKSDGIEIDGERAERGERETKTKRNRMG